MTDTIQPLSASSQGGLIPTLPTFPTYSVAHTVPVGETHRVKICCNNTLAIGDIRVVGDFKGGASDQTIVMDITIPFMTCVDILKDHILDGPCTIELSAIANGSSARISGIVEVVRRK